MKLTLINKALMLATIVLFITATILAFKGANPSNIGYSEIYSYIKPTNLDYLQSKVINGLMVTTLLSVVTIKGK